MTPTTWLKRTLMCALLAAPLAACGSSDETLLAQPRPDYKYLTKLRLNVASVDIDDSLAPAADPRDMSRMAPIPPVEALRQMGQDRLAALGNTGHAVFVIDEATILAIRDNYEGKFTVHLDVTNADGSRTGYAEASVSRKTTILNDKPNATRNALGALVTQMMTDMNNEFEFQVKRSLRAYLQSTDQPKTQPPSPIQTEDLTAPTP